MRIWKIQKKKESENSNRKNTNQIIGVVVGILALLGTLLPGWLLVWQSEGEMGMVSAAPVEYYSPANLAVARNASANLGIYQKLQLITGKWESNIGQADSYECEMEDFEAVELAKEKLDELYQNALYPVSLTSGYGNWYTWEAEFCKVVDAMFDTYAAYYWKIRFEKYDGTQWHDVYMMEDGTIFFAEACEMDGLDVSQILPVSEIEIDSSLYEERIVKQDASDRGLEQGEYLAFTGIDTADLQSMDLLQLRVGERIYHVVQANSKERYVYVVQPVEDSVKNWE